MLASWLHSNTVMATRPWAFCRYPCFCRSATQPLSPAQREALGGAAQGEPNLSRVLCSRAFIEKQVRLSWCWLWDGRGGTSLSAGSEVSRFAAAGTDPVGPGSLLSQHHAAALRGSQREWGQRLLLCLRLQSSLPPWVCVPCTWRSEQWISLCLLLSSQVLVSRELDGASCGSSR